MCIVLVSSTCSAIKSQRVFESQAINLTKANGQNFHKLPYTCFFYKHIVQMFRVFLQQLATNFTDSLYVGCITTIDAIVYSCMRTKATLGLCKSRFPCCCLHMRIVAASDLEKILASHVRNFFCEIFKSEVGTSVHVYADYLLHAMQPIYRELKSEKLSNTR